LPKKKKFQAAGWKPLNDTVLLEVTDSPAELHVCKVVAVGPGLPTYAKTRLKMSVKVGDKVLIARYPHTDIFFGKRKLLLVSERRILMKKK
jgi:co-chaperonin GroES (HSP10)